jgi:type VI protein secretion system component Hcp
VIAFTRIDADGPVEYLRYELERCTVVGFELADVGDDRPAETFSLRYGQLNMVSYAGGHGTKGAQSSVLLMNGG